MYYEVILVFLVSPLLVSTQECEIQEQNDYYLERNSNDIMWCVTSDEEFEKCTYLGMVSHKMSIITIFGHKY